MQISNLPAKWFKPFAADDANKVEIPVTSADPTRASQSAGFPPLTMQPPESGGVPPQGEDFNGAMNQVARIVWWQCLGGGAIPYDGAWAANAAINGYPSGARIASADLQGGWISTADNNLNNPDTVGTNWVPGYAYGASTIGTTGVNLATSTTLTPAQAAKQIVFVQGNLTAATTIVFPAWVKSWIVVNNTGTGAFTLTVKTAAGAGVTINRGDVVPVLCDGTNMTVAQVAASARIARYTSPGSFTVPAGVTTLYATGCAGGGAGGSTLAVGATGNIVAGGGGGGAGQNCIRLPLAVTPGQVLPVAIGAPGSAGGIGASGGVGGGTSLGGILVLTPGGGGLPGAGGLSGSAWAGGAGGPGGTGGTGGGQNGQGGGDASDAQVNVTAISGAGGSSPFGGAGLGRRGAINSNLQGYAAQGYGSGGGGGGGSYSGGAVSPGAQGGNGGAGFLMIEW